MAGSLEHLLLSKIIETGSLQEVTGAGLKPIHWGTWEDKYQWVLNYQQEHSAVPTHRAWAAQWGHLEILDVEDEPFSGLIAELLDAYKSRVIVEAVSAAMPKLESDDTTAAMQILSSGLQKASVDVARLRDVDLIENWEDRLAQYEEMRANPNSLRGIPTGFHGLDMITHGLRPQQLIVLGGEAKMGKSIIEMIIAKACHNFGKVPLLVSFEMAIEEQAARHDALSAGVDYDHILSGNLSEREMELIRRSMILRKNMQPFWMTEDTSSLTTISALAGKLQEYQPDMLLVDGAYLMDDENGEPKGSPQAMTNISRGLKRLAQRFDIPVFVTTQVLGWKLDSKKSRAVTAGAFGYTSAWGQDADLLLAIERNPDIDNQSIIRVVEARTAPRAKFAISWNWQKMEFTEVTDDDDDDDDGHRFG